MNVNGNNDLADVVAIMKMRYAVLTKKSRIEVLVKPTAKQLRKRGKRGWQLFCTIDCRTDAARLLEESCRSLWQRSKATGDLRTAKRGRLP
jgi:hypothetical protein